MQYTHSRFITFISIIGFFLSTSIACAATKKQNTPDEQQPVNISANSLLASEKTGKSVYKGNVIITQGSLTLKGETVNITHPKNQLTTVVANGNPATFKRFSQIDQAWLKGKAQKIEYNALNKTVLLIGNAVVEQPGKHVISGPKLFYDIAKQTLQAQSTATENKRISVTLNPATNKITNTNKPGSNKTNQANKTTKQNTPATQAE
ncbi:lipopolysaccharide transport periplasmic protein LptA [Thiomicrorhabdus sp. Kp2]|uniref:lipopolysaccharide transport periplasmic protein LptA n=1 Tax=Thiomicrorhabdus sp. Kp2 TaxID=1123518 RepID=UPI0003F894D3|nr:lipopolysaccharide transport periplasmic protein LptA [Thiomicrorhabdus sp. Kp2]